MPHAWKLQDAKNRLSEVIDLAESEGPQTVTRHGEPTAVILSVADYQRLSKPSQNLVEFFQQSPLKGVTIDTTRSKDLPRSVKI